MLNYKNSSNFFFFIMIEKYIYNNNYNKTIYIEQGDFAVTDVPRIGKNITTHFVND